MVVFTILTGLSRIEDSEGSISVTKTYRQIRADYDRDSIVVYQAYNDAIADTALKANRFVSPFSFRRMTWIKPSFLWLMVRSGWGTKSNQTRILSIRMKRSGWDQSLAEGVLTAFDPDVHQSVQHWGNAFDSAPIHVQWDPERSIHGKKMDFRAIQVGISRHRIEEYINNWVLEIRDLTATADKIRKLRQIGRYDKAKLTLPRERIYPVAEETARKLGIGM